MTVKEYMTVKLLFESYDDDKEIMRQLLKLNKHLTLDDANKMVINYLDGVHKKQEDVIQRFTYNGVEFGLIPNLENMYTIEFLEIESYEDKTDKIHKLLSVLYRPVKYSIFKGYEIEKFVDANKYSDIMLEIDIKIYHSVIGFFLSLNEILLQNTQESITSLYQKKVKQKQND